AAKREAKPLLSFAEAKKRKPKIEWSEANVAVPEWTGTRMIQRLPLDELVPFIDWTPFFTSWELKGLYPQIFEDEVVGQVARELFDEAQEVLQKIVARQSFETRAVYGFWPANSDGEDIVLYNDTSRSREISRFPMLRQQFEKNDARPDMS